MDNIGNKIGLALSGGGYRAAAYHVGTLRALRYLGLLDKVDVISSVSGGSIVAAYYLLHKENFRTFLKDFNKKIAAKTKESSEMNKGVANIDFLTSPQQIQGTENAIQKALKVDDIKFDFSALPGAMQAAAEEAKHFK